MVEAAVGSRSLVTGNFSKEKSHVTVLVEAGPTAIMWEPQATCDLQPVTNTRIPDHISTIPDT